MLRLETDRIYLPYMSTELKCTISIFDLKLLVTHVPVLQLQSANVCD